MKEAYARTQNTGGSMICHVMGSVTLYPDNWPGVIPHQEACKSGAEILEHARKSGAQLFMFYFRDGSYFPSRGCEIESEKAKKALKRLDKYFSQK